LDLLGGERGSGGEVIGNGETIVMLGKLRESQDIEDFIGESWNKGGFGEKFDCALQSLELF
jgi:hypothetical protein